MKTGNWEDSLEKVKGRLEKWKQRLPNMSLGGRTLVFNNLVSSSLWHKMMGIDPLAPLLVAEEEPFPAIFWNLILMTALAPR